MLIKRKVHPPTCLLAPAEWTWGCGEQLGTSPWVGLAPPPLFPITSLALLVPDSHNLMSRSESKDDLSAERS